MSKKLLIVGASFLQVPMIKKAKEMGLYVAVADYNPSAVGIKYADEYFNCSTIDKDGLLEVALKFKPDGIATMATDMPMRAIAYVCSKIGLNSISENTAYLATDKIKMIKQFKLYGVSSPIFEECENFEECIESFEKIKRLPLILKPSDSSGSRGVIKVNSKDKLKESFEYAKNSSRDGKVIIEEFMDGPEVSVECFGINGDIHILQVTDKITTGAPHFVELGHIQPSSLKKEEIDKIKELAIKACLSLGIINGPAHAEIIVTNDGPKMVEIGARMGGDCITSDLVPLSTGIDMVKATIDYSLGNKIIINKLWNKYSAIKFIVPKDNAIKKIIIPKIKHKNIKVEILKKNGDFNTIVCSSNDRLGYIIGDGYNLDELISILNDYENKIKYIN